MSWSLRNTDAIGDIAVAHMITELFRQRGGSPVVGIPAGIKSPLQTFKNQLRAACRGQSFPAVLQLRVNLDFNPSVIYGIGRSAGDQLSAAERGDAKTIFSVLLITGKLRCQIVGPFRFFRFKIDFSSIGASRYPSGRLSA